VNAASSALVLGALLTISGCATTVTTVRTVTPEEYGAQSWIGHTERDVSTAWGPNTRKEPDGLGGYTLTYGKFSSSDAVSARATSDPGQPGQQVLPTGPSGPSQQGTTTIDELAKFWIGPDGKVYRFWFAAEVYKKGLDAPTARPLETYGKKKP